jgi:tRNA(Ile)-lysidine synthase
MIAPHAPRCACTDLRAAARTICKEHKRVILSVSGGCDSMCLLHAIASEKHDLCHPWCKSRATTLLSEPVVVTVNHGLRSESASECNLVTRYAMQLGLQAHAVSLDVGPCRKSKVMDAARRKRYAALAGAAIHHNATAVLMAHHAGTCLHHHVKQEQHQLYTTC